MRGIAMKFKIGLRIPSITKRIAARTSVKRIVRHNLGLKAPRGLGLVTNPKKAVYNRIYRRTTKSCPGFILIFLIAIIAGVFARQH
jgi:hypothetical protein